MASNKLRRKQYRQITEPVSTVPSQLSLTEDNEETIDLGEVWTLIKKHFWSLIIVTVIGGVLGGLLTWAFIPTTYASSGTIFLTPRVSQGEIDLNSLNSNQKLVSNVMNLLTQDTIMTTVAQDTGLDSVKEVRDALSITNTDNTEIITIIATTKDAKLSKDIVVDTIDTFINTMQKSLNVENIQITDEPKLDYTPVGPSIKRNALIGAILGLAIGLVWILIGMMKDKTLKTREEAEKFLGLPVYAELPDLETKTTKK